MDVCNVDPNSPLCAPVEGGNYIRYTFITETETHIMYIENRRLEIDGVIYLIYGEYPTNKCWIFLFLIYLLLDIIMRRGKDEK